MTSYGGIIEHVKLPEMSLLSPQPCKLLVFKLSCMCKGKCTADFLMETIHTFELPGLCIDTNLTAYTKVFQQKTFLREQEKRERQTEKKWEGGRKRISGKRVS